ncbi:MAG: IS21 family transposase [Planctomycetales bacterium]
MTEELRNQVVNLWRDGASERVISRTLGIARGTVRRILAEHDAVRRGATTAKPRRPSLLDAYENVIQELLGRYPDITVVRMHEELRTRGFTGKYTIVRDRLCALRPQTPRQPVVRFETAPGVQAQMDYSTYDIEFTEEGRRRVQAFSYVLGYSRRQYLRFVESQDFYTTIQQHVRAFEHLGGAAATCLYDNMKVVVTGHDHDVPIYNTQFVNFATHYGFRPVACQPRRPQTKGKVERQFYFVQMNLLNGRTFRSLAHLNEVTEQWLAEVADVRTHAETRQTPRDRHALELPHLIPLPATHYETAQVVYRSVSAEGFVHWKQNLYSVPWRYLGQRLPVRVTPDEVIVYSPLLDVEVARHPLLSGGVSRQKQIDPAHHQPVDVARHRVAMLREQYEELGAIAVRFLEGLLRTQRYHWDHAQRILGLLGIYSRADLLRAFERANRYGAYSSSAVERILTTQARPLPLSERLTGQGEIPDPSPGDSATIEPRNIAEYQPLLSPEPPADVPPREADQTISSEHEPPRERDQRSPDGQSHEAPDDGCPF